MKKVLFLSADNIYAQTGAAKFARLLMADNDKWKNEGYDLICLSNNGAFSDVTIYRRSIKHKMKQAVKAFLGKTNIGKRISFLNYQIRILGAAPVEKSRQYLNNQVCVILNDLRVAYNFYKKYGETQNTIFIMHNSGELLSMLQTEMTDKKIRRFLISCENMILKNASKLLFVSEVARKNFVELHPEYSEKTETIYIGIDESYRHVPNKEQIIRFVTVGTVCDRKNQILAIRAIERIREQNIFLTVVGGGPALKKCQKYVKKHNLEDKVNFTGSTNKVGEILEKSDVFIMTSKDEGLPVAAQEAMSAGLPLILTDVGGCRELIQGNGLLIQPVLDEVVDAIQTFVKNKEQLIEYGNNSYNLFYTNFSIKRMQEQYLKLIKSIFADL